MAYSNQQKVNQVQNALNAAAGRLNVSQETADQRTRTASSTQSSSKMQGESSSASSTAQQTAQQTTGQSLADEDIANLRNILANVTGQLTGTVPTNVDFNALSNAAATQVLQQGMGGIIAQGTNVGAYNGTPQADAATKLAAQAQITGATAAANAALTQNQQLLNATSSLTDILKGAQTSQASSGTTDTQQAAKGTQSQTTDSTSKTRGTQSTSGQSTSVDNKSSNAMMQLMLQMMTGMGG